MKKLCTAPAASGVFPDFSTLTLPARCAAPESVQ
jgi:hypothetical protein